MINLMPDYHKVSKFPGTSRDLAFLAPVGTKSADILAVIKKDGGEYLEGVRLFDMYQGKQVPRGFKSLAYSLSFRSDEGTLTDSDIEGNIEAIVNELKESLGCQLR